VLFAVRHFCRSGPTCRSCLPRPPRLIFVGVTDRLLEITAICKSDRPGMGMASTSGLRLPSAVRLLGARSAEEARPALGFSSCRVIGHLSPCIGRARPRLPITRLRNIVAPHSLTRDASYPLMGLATILPITRDFQTPEAAPTP
jgi:hypothetical protein